MKSRKNTLINRVLYGGMSDEEFKQLENKKPLTNEFEVRDALRGNVTGDFDKDFEILWNQGQVTSPDIYYEAYSNTVNP